MSVKCSIFGHKYGEAEIERERQEQGSEVISTIQEHQTCERCGKTRIVSENKEVTAVETPADVTDELVAEEEQEQAESIEEPDTPPTATESDETNSGFEQSIEADANDAEIIDDTDGVDDNSSGVDDDSEPTPGFEVPDAEPESTGPETDPETDDGVIIDAEPEDNGVRSDRVPGQWPEEPGDDGDDWAPETAQDEESNDSATFDSPGGNAVTVPDGQFYCPECEFTADVTASSLRVGDFCPECHKGALVNSDE